MNTEPSDLDEAARRVRAGELGAFARIVDASSDRMFRVAVRLVGSAEEARELVQDSYLRAYEAMRDGRYRPDVGVQGWLYSIVTRAALDLLRARKRRQRLTPHSASIDRGAETDVHARLVLGYVAGLLDELPAEQRVALLLKAVDGLSTREVAHAMGCSEGAVEQRLVRARETLRRRMDDTP